MAEYDREYWSRGRALIKADRLRDAPEDLPERVRAAVDAAAEARSWSELLGTRRDGDTRRAAGETRGGASVMIEGWVEDLEQEVRTCLGRGSLTPEQLAARLGVSPATAVSFILLLASADRLRIERVSLKPAEAAAGALSRAA